MEYTTISQNAVLVMDIIEFTAIALLGLVIAFGCLAVRSKRIK